MTDEMAAPARRFSFGEIEFASSPLYRRLSMLVAGDAELLEFASHCRTGQQPPNLLFAAVHFLLLGGTAHPLAAYYPSVAARPRTSLDGVEETFRSFCREHRDAVIGLISTRFVQTNVVKRSVALRLGLAAVATRGSGPVTMIEIGCSAGLLLCFDRYTYRVGGCPAGMPDAAVCLESEWRSEASPPDLDALPPVVDRLGIDLHPVNPADEEECRWLRALVWPENDHELDVLERALAIARPASPRMIAGDAAEVLPRLAAELPPGRAVVVFHAATRNHVPREHRDRFDGAIVALGRDRPLFWLSLEAGALALDPRVPRGLPAHVLGLRTIRDTQRTEEHLALVEPHADWIQPLDL
jgi:hypothetical protein